jgi:hypothetical protein
VVEGMIKTLTDEVTEEEQFCLETGKGSIKVTERFV